jgi:hypothetical protein
LPHVLNLVQHGIDPHKVIPLIFTPSSLAAARFVIQGKSGMGTIPGLQQKVLDGVATGTKWGLHLGPDIPREVD